MNNITFIEIAKNVYESKLFKNSTKNDIIKTFYNLAREFGVKRGIKDENGNVRTDSFEWSMLKDAFFQKLIGEINWELLWRETPEDIFS